MTADEVRYNTEPVAVVDGAVLADLKSRALASGGGTVRLCLHRSPGDAVHEMLIAHRRGLYVRPHRHDADVESFLVLDGRMWVVFFDEAGRPTRRLALGPPGGGGSFLCRVEAGRWHTMLPLTEAVVFLETTQGPFRGAAHSTFADWAPPPDDEAAVERYMEALLRGAGTA
jgi:cupin fold WbuC family metalloprotein